MDGEQANPECSGCRSLQKKLAALEAELAELRQIIEELRRAGKRQAGPFSKGPPKVKPKRPGRKPGDDYRAESLARPGSSPQAVVNRKVWGGNRTDRGATAQGTLSTIGLTALQRALDALAWLQRLRQSPQTLHLPR
jgi:hypothetical protein